MKSAKYDYWVNIEEIKPPLPGGGNFSAKAKIHEIGGDEVQHGLGEIWGKTREEVHGRMNELIRQWVQVNEK